MKQSREAWKPGAVWKSKTGHTEAIICGMDKDTRVNQKLVHMTNTLNYYPVVHHQNYQNKHIMEYFEFTGGFKDIPSNDYERDEK